MSVAEKRLTGRIAAEHIKLMAVPRPPQGVVERFKALGDCDRHHLRHHG